MRRTALLALAIAGCAVGPSYTPPRVRTPERFGSAHPSMQGDAGDLSRFWERFGDPLLSRLVELAIERNPDLHAAQARLRQARARRAAAGAELFPTLGYSGDVRRTRTGVQFAGTSLAGTTNDTTVSTGATSTRSTYAAGFDASWELDIFGGRRRALEAAEADVEASAAELAATRVSLVAEVALTYVELRSFQTRLAIARENLESQSDTLQIVEWRALAGLVTSLDVEQARRNREQTRAAIPPLQLGAGEAQHRLGILLGLAPGALRRRLSRPAPIPQVPERVLVGIPAATLSRRPDVHAAERRIAAETARIGQAIAAQLPSLTLSGSIGIEALIGNAPGLAYSLLAGVAGPLFDAGRRQSQVDLQRAISEEALASYHATILTALEEVENALVAVAANRERRAALEVARQAANDAVMLSRAQYEAGLIDFQTVLDTERSQLLVEESLASTRAETVSAVIQLYKALGGGWSPSTPSTE